MSTSGVKITMIVLTHIGNPLPNYVAYSIVHLRRYNPNANVSFILDPSIQNQNMDKVLKKYDIKIIDSRVYESNSLIKDLNRLTWIKTLHPLGPPTTYGSQPNFWHLTMERLFYLNAFINSRSESDVIHMENDNVMYYDYKIALNYSDENSISCLHRKHFGENSTLFSFVAIKNPEIMDLICRKILHLVSMGEKSLQNTYGLDHISEMHLLSIIKHETDLLKYFPMLPSDDEEYIFDPYGYGAFLLGDNLNHGPGHIDTTDNIGQLLGTNNFQLKMLNHAPILRDVSSEKIYKIFNLHVHRKNIEKLL